MVFFIFVNLYCEEDVFGFDVGWGFFFRFIKLFMDFLFLEVI